MLDFTTRKKKKYMVKLHDGFVAVLPMPSKKIFDRLTAAQEMSDIGEVYSLLKDYLGSVKDVVTDPN